MTLERIDDISINSYIQDIKSKKTKLIKARFVKDKKLAGTEPYTSIRKATLAGDVEKIKEYTLKETAYQKACDLLFNTEYLNDRVQFDELFAIMLQIYKHHNSALGYYLEADSIEQKYKEIKEAEAKEAKQEGKAAKKSKNKPEKHYNKPPKFSFDE